DLDGRPRIFGVGPARDQVEAAVLALDTLDLPSSRFLVANHKLHRNPLDVGVLDHGGEPWRGPFGVGQNPGTADVNDVGDGTMPLPLEFKEALLEPVVEPVEVSLGLGNQPVETLNRLPLDLAIEQVGELPVLAIDQRVE